MRSINQRLRNKAQDHEMVALMQVSAEPTEKAKDQYGIEIFVIPNLKSYFSTEDIIQLYEVAIYNKIYLIVIEPIQTPHIEGEKGWIIDEDLCIIEL